MAEPKPASEKPNLVAVTPEPKGGGEAAAKPPTTGPAQQAPKSAATLGRVTPAADAPREQKGTRWGLWLLVLLVATAAVTAWVQTQRLDQAHSRVTALSEQVLGIQAQLSAANTQIQTYEMQRGQVREAVSEIAQRVLMLNELVGGPSELTPASEADSAP